MLYFSERYVIVRQRLLTAMQKTVEELRFLACVVGHENIDGIKGYGYVRAADKLKELKASSQAKTAIGWLRAWENELKQAAKKPKDDAASDALAKITLCIEQSNTLLRHFRDTKADAVHPPRKVELVTPFESFAKRFVCEKKSADVYRRESLHTRMEERSFDFSATNKNDQQPIPARKIKNHDQWVLGQRVARDAISKHRGNKAIALNNYFKFDENMYKYLPNGMSTLVL